MTIALEIRGVGRSYYVYHEGQQMAGPYSSHDNAVTALGGIERRLQPGRARFRKCCRCHRGYMSVDLFPLCPSCERQRRK